MKYVIATCLLVASAPTLAAVPVEQAIELCRAEQNALRRLTCYDAIQMTASEQAAPRVETPPQQTTSKAPASKADDFGFEHIQKEENLSDLVHVVVKAIRYSPRKELIVEFDNGQVWRQTDSGRYAINVGETHYVKRGVLNSFFLGNDNNNRTIRIRREQ